VDTAAEALARVPGGPPPSEARRRLRSGLPLLVGISRRRAEQIQGELLDLGVVPRLGPAPRGTRPLGSEPGDPGVLGRVLLGVLVPALAVATFWGVDRVRSRRQEVELSRQGAPPVVIAAQRQLLANATITRTRAGWMVLDGRVQVVSADLQPQREIELSLHRGSTLVWTQSFTPPTPRRPDRARSARFRASLPKLELRDGEKLELRVIWDGWRAEPVELTVPSAP